MRARELVAAALMIVTGACAQQDAGERMVTPTPLDAPAPPREPNRAELDQNELENEESDELGLAEYERLLADKETRLRAAGVLLAARRQGAEEARGGGFAAPPPATAPSGNEYFVGEATGKSKREAKGAGRSGDVATAAPPAPPPAPSPKKPSTSTSTAARDSRAKKVKYDAEPVQNEAAGPVPEAAAAEPVGRCQNICDLSAATCDLEGKICDLAARHTDDPRYGELCRRAEDDCRQAAEACQRCSP